MKDIIKRTDGKKWSFTEVANEKQTLKDIIDDLYFKSGEILSLGGVMMNGYISTSSKTVVVDYILPKSFKNLDISITNFTATMRGDKGYLNNTSGRQNLLTADYDITIDKYNDKKIKISINKSSGFTNVTNNTPVSLDTSITLEFI